MSDVVRKVAGAALDEQTRREVRRLVESQAIISWELLEDMGLFWLFDKLPTREELEPLLTNRTQLGSASGAVES